jgi:hypothetical protein
MRSRKGVKMPRHYAEQDTESDVSRWYNSLEATGKRSKAWKQSAGFRSAFEKMDDPRRVSLLRELDRRGINAREFFGYLPQAPPVAQAAGGEVTDGGSIFDFLGESRLADIPYGGTAYRRRREEGE